MFCKYCGARNNEDAKFCRNCGKEIIKPKISNKRNVKWFLISVIAFVIILLVSALIFLLSNNTNNKDDKIKISLSVVNILCDNGNGGSGTMIDSEGFVITNNHVLEKTEVCLVTIPNTDTGAPEEIYIAGPITIPSLSEEYDIAMLKIEMAYEDSDGKVWGEYPKTFIAYKQPDICGDNNHKMGESVRIYGYPAMSGGLNLTITDGIISGFSDNNEILTSAKIDSGNSGGLAVNNDGCMLGIPSAVLTGEYENLGVIIPNNTILEFLDKIPNE